MIKNLRIPDDEGDVWKEFTKVVAFERKQIWEVIKPMMERYTAQATKRIKKELNQV